MQTVWSKIREKLEKTLPAGEFKVWIAPLVPAEGNSLPEFDGKELVLLAPGEYAAGCVRSRFLGVLNEAAAQACAMPPHLTISAGAAAPAAKRVEPKPLPPAAPAQQLALPLQVPAAPAAPAFLWRHSFEDFVVGPSNDLAFAASQSVCRDSGFDILFLSSGPGLGKTHLMQAVGKTLGAACNRAQPRVEYLNAETFASQFYLALKSRDLDRFKARYRSCDLLLLEDVHFLQEKEKTQAELLATLEALRARGSKIVFTSSFLPRDLRAMDECLLSRLTAGVVGCIECPDEDTRRRILRRKASVHQVLLPDEAEDVLVRHLCADVRQIESCLRSLILKARLCNGLITARMALEVVRQFANDNPALDLDEIIRQVCRGFGLSREQLLSVVKKQDYVAARNTAFYLARKHTDMSLEAIGKSFNRRHSTVIKGITNFEREISRQTVLGRRMAGAVALIERNSVA